MAALEPSDSILIPEGAASEKVQLVVVVMAGFGDPKGLLQPECLCEVLALLPLCCVCSPNFQGVRCPSEAAAVAGCVLLAQLATCCPQGLECCCFYHPRKKGIL